MICKNCLRAFSGSHDYSRHLASCNGSPKQCPYCRAWFMTQGQRDAHVTKKHGPLAVNPKTGAAMRVHTLLFDKRTFTPHQAKAWAHAHGYRVGQMEVSPAGRYVHLVQTPRTGRVTRIIPIGSTLSGIRAIVTRNPLCCP